MTVRKLKMLIDNLPDEMPVVTPQDDNPDLVDLIEVEVISVQEHPNGFNYPPTGGLETIKVCRLI